MKKFSLILITGLTMLANSVCSFQAGAQVTAGAKLGVGLASFSAEFDDDLKTKAGLVIGGFATYKLPNRVSLQGELLFSMQGAKEDNGSYNFNYINIPLSLRYNAWQGLHFFGGPQIGFLSSAKIKEGRDKEDIRDAVKGNDFSFFLGAAYEWKKGIIADLRWVKGLSDISDNEALVKNKGIQLTIGYRLGRR